MRVHSTTLEAALVFFISCGVPHHSTAKTHAQTEDIQNATVKKTPFMAQPKYMQTMLDPVFGTKFTRVTEPGRELLPRHRCNSQYCRHRYSSTQAWNADETLLLITNGCPGYCFLDGKTYKPLFWRNSLRGDDCKWDPADARSMICVNSDRIDIWHPKTNSRINVYKSQLFHDLEFGPWKGNPSDDGSMIALRAVNKKGERVAFAFNIRTRKKYRDIGLDKLRGHNKLVAISASGRYIFLSQRMKNGVEPAYIFTVNGKFVQYWPKHHRPGHGDMTIDEDGQDVYVGISKSDPDKYCIIKRRLIDGAVTVLAPYGDARHVSTRNIKLRGWAFVSYQGSYLNVVKKKYPAPFYGEIVAIRIDGSGEIRRIVQTHGIDGGYMAETHGSPSPSGSQVIWASNWGRALGPVSDYVSKISFENMNNEQK